MIETLESRIAPATFTVTSLADDDGGNLLTLREAIAAANLTPAADTIVFGGAAAAGGEIAVAGQLVITSSLTIKGPGAGKLILDGGNATNVFVITDSSPTVRSVAISGLSIVDGNSGASPGGGIFSAESLTLSNVVISSSVTSGNGGGLFIDTPGKVLLKSCLLSGNSAGGQGGGAFIAAEGSAQIIGCTISGNNSGVTGGGLSVDFLTTAKGDVVIDGCKVMGNSTSGSGGGAYLENNRSVNGVEVGKVTVKNSVVSGNSAASIGGGLFFNESVVLVESTRLSNNTAKLGGGIYDSESNGFTLKGSNLTANRATGADAGDGGGGLYIDEDPKALIQSCVFSGNTSASDGGGFVAASARLQVKSTTFSGNVAAGDGGGGFGFDGSVLTVESASFLDNRAFAGGGLRTEGTAIDAVKLTVKSSLFQGNRAVSGGGLSTVGDGAVAIVATKLLANSAGSDGGGAALASSASIVISGGLVGQNTATSSGGGLILMGTGAKSLAGVVIRDNFAFGSGDSTGGGIWLGAGSLSLSKTTSVLNNVATSRGGGIANFTATPVTLSGAKVVFNTAATDAQIFGPFTP